MVVLSREPDGRWYVAFAVDTEFPEPLPAAGRAVGVDLGVQDFAVTSAGEKIANPHPGGPGLADISSAGSHRLTSGQNVRRGGPEDLTVAELEERGDDWSRRQDGGRRG